MNDVMKELASSFGLEFEAIDPNSTGLEQMSMGEIINGKSIFSIPNMKQGFLRLGEFTLVDLSGKELHDIAKWRNREVKKLAKEYAEIRSLEDVKFDGFIHSHKLNIKYPFLEEEVSEEKNTEYNLKHLYDVYQYNSMHQASAENLKYNSSSVINFFLIPCIETFWHCYKNLRHIAFDHKKLTPEDYEEWKTFILSSNATSLRFLRTFYTSYLDFNLFKRHAYIIGATGSGKTEFLKVVAHHIINEATQYPEKKISGLMIDPHGDFAEEVARFKECYNNDNIIYFDPKLYPDKTPCIDIFSPRDYEEDTIEIEANNLVNAFQEIIGDASLSAQMETLLKPCIAVLLRREHSTLHDLQRFMIGDDNKDLIELGKNAPNRAHSEFFKNGFHQKNFDTTKRGIYTRIQTLLNSDIFNRLISPHATLDIEKALEDGKFIIMSLSRGGIGKDVSSAFGRLVLAKIKNAGFRRANIPKNQRAESYIFIDECQNYVGESIEQTLTELRKYGIHMILANQVIGQDMSQQLKNIILSNTAVKIVGSNANKTLSVMAKETGAKLEDLEQLTVGRFCGKVKHDKLITKPFYFTSPIDFLGNKNSMASDQWKEQKKKGWSCYVNNNIINESVDASTKAHSISIDETVSSGGEKPAFKL
jgi:hypothetical protein